MARKLKKIRRPDADPSGIPPELRKRLCAISITREEFSHVVADILRLALPDVQVVVKGPLELDLNRESDKRCVRMSLYSTWNLGKDDLEHRLDAVSSHVINAAGMFRNTTDLTESPDRNKIVPMLKNDSFVRHTIEQMRGMDGLVAERLVADIWVAYAIDRPGSLAYLSENMRKMMDISLEELRKLAPVNLTRTVPVIGRVGEAPRFMMTAGGTLEASLLVLDALWREQEKHVDGELVLAVPSREVVMFTGSNCKDVIDGMKRQIKEIARATPYFVSEALLVWRNGRWEEYEPPKLKGPLN